MSSSTTIRDVRRGRRLKGVSNPKDDIIKAAVHVFTQFPYDSAPIRTIASRAHVDPALIYHYFQTKERLFSDAMKFQLNPPDGAEIPINESPMERGERIIMMFMKRWGGTDESSPFLALMKSATQNQTAAAMLRGLFNVHLIGHLSKEFGPDSAGLRGGMGSSIVLGLAIVRYILQLEPLASMPIQDLARIASLSMAPYLDRDFPVRSNDRSTVQKWTK